MKENTSRRDLLKLTGTATLTASTFSGQVIAEGQQTEDRTDDSLPTGSSLKLRNQATEEATITVNFYEVTELGAKARTDPKFSETASLPPHDAGSVSAKSGTSLLPSEHEVDSLPSGEYLVEASMAGDAESTESIRWATAPWRDLVVNLRPGNEIFIGSRERTLPVE